MNAKRWTALGAALACALALQGCTEESPDNPFADGGDGGDRENCLGCHTDADLLLELAGRAPERPEIREDG